MSKSGLGMSLSVSSFFLDSHLCCSVAVVIKSGFDSRQFLDEFFAKVYTINGSPHFL